MLKAIIIGVVLIWLLLKVSGRTGRADKTNHPTRSSQIAAYYDDPYMDDYDDLYETGLPDDENGDGIPDDEEWDS